MNVIYGDSEYPRDGMTAQIHVQNSDFPVFISAVKRRCQTRCHHAFPDAAFSEEEEEDEGNAEGNEEGAEGEDEPEDKEVIRNIHYQHPRKCITKYVNVVGGRGKEGKQMTKPSEKQKLKEISNGPEFRRHS